MDKDRKGFYLYKYSVLGNWSWRLQRSFSEIKFHGKYFSLKHTTEKEPDCFWWEVGAITRGFFTGDSSAPGSGICEEFSALVLCLFGVWILAGEGCPGLADPHPSQGSWQCSPQGTPRGVQPCPRVTHGTQLGKKNSLMGKEERKTARLVMLPLFPVWKFKAWSWQAPEQPWGAVTASLKHQVTAGQGLSPPHGP